MAEAGLPSFEASTWLGLFAPAATPKEIIAKLNTEAMAGLSVPDLRERLLREGCTPVGGTPQELAAYVSAETAKWSKIIRDAGIRAEY